MATNTTPQEQPGEPIQRVGLIVVDADTLDPWRSWLTFADVPPFVWIPGNDRPVHHLVTLPKPHMWVVVLPDNYDPAAGRVWLRHLNTHTLLLSAHVEAAVDVIGAVLPPAVPVVVADPRDAAQQLWRYLDWAIYLMYGHILFPSQTERAPGGSYVA